MNALAISTHKFLYKQMMPWLISVVYASIFWDSLILLHVN